MPQSEIKEKEIIEILKDLPQNKLNEVLDFAEYLRSKERKIVKPRKTGHFKLPSLHLGIISKGAFDRNTLYGEYLDRKLD